MSLFRSLFRDRVVSTLKVTQYHPRTYTPTKGVTNIPNLPDVDDGWTYVNPEKFIAVAIFEDGKVSERMFHLDKFCTSQKLDIRDATKAIYSGCFFAIKSPNLYVVRPNRRATRLCRVRNLPKKG